MFISINVWGDVVVSVTGVLQKGKYLAYVLTCVLLAMSGWAPAARAFSGVGDGSVGNPYRITNCAELQEYTFKKLNLALNQPEQDATSSQ
jgi:hypothetical protein